MCMKIQNYKLFIEAKLADILKVKSSGSDDGEVEKQIKAYQELKIDLKDKLIKYITLEKRVSKKKVRLEISYYDTAIHNIKKRLDDRTSFATIDEFNERLKSLINKVFPDMVGKELFSDGRYTIYDVEKNMSVLFDFYLKDFMKDSFKINIVTVLPGQKGTEGKILNIDLSV